MNHLPKKALLGLALVFGASAAMADCGDVQIAEMNWASAELMANVDKLILEKGYGCNVSLIPGATMPTFTSLNEKGRTGRRAGALDQRRARSPEGRVGRGQDDIRQRRPHHRPGRGLVGSALRRGKTPRAQDRAGCVGASRSLPGCGGFLKGCVRRMPRRLGLPAHQRKPVPRVQDGRKGLEARGPGFGSRAGRLNVQGGQPRRELVRLLLVADRPDRQAQDGQARFRRAVCRQRALGWLYRQAGTRIAQIRRRRPGRSRKCIPWSPPTSRSKPARR